MIRCLDTLLPVQKTSDFDRYVLSLDDYGEWNRTCGGSTRVIALREDRRRIAASTSGTATSGFGIDLEQTAQVVGRSVNATCAIRTRFAKIAEGRMEPPRAKTASRNHALVNLEHEARILVYGSERAD